MPAIRFCRKGLVMLRRLAILFVIGCALVSLAAACSPTAPTAAPIVSLFAADNSRIAVNTPTTLRWDVIGKDVVCRIDPALGNVPAAGSAEVRPTATTTYTLACTNVGGTVTRSATITTF